MVSIIRFLLLIGLLFSQAAIAGGDTCETSQSGNWEDPSVWIGCGGGIPIDDTFVLIKTGHIITINGDSAQLNEFSMETGSELIVADVPGGITVISEFSDFDSSLGTITLLGDLTVFGDNDNVILGVVDGAAGLTINSNLETRFTGTIGINTALTSLTTDAIGTTVIDIAFGDINNPNIIVNGARIINDDVTLEQLTHFRGGAGPLTFNGKVDGATSFLVSGLGTETLTFADDVGTINRIGNFRMMGSPDANAVLKLNNLISRGVQEWQINLILDSPTQTVNLINQSPSRDTQLGELNTTVRGVSAGTQSLNVTVANGIIINGPIGGGGLPLLNLQVNATSSTTILTDSIITVGAQNYTGNVLLDTDSMLTGDSIALQAMELAAFNLTLDTIDTSGSTQITGEMSGSGDFTKQGTGILAMTIPATMTGKANIIGGTLLDNTLSDSPFPAATEIHISSVGSIDSGGSGLTLFDGQTISGNGVCQCILLAAPGSTISPGNSPGELFVFQTEMYTASTLEIDLNGTGNSDYDRLSVESANLDLDQTGGISLALSLNFEPAVGDEFTIMPIFTEQPISGTFSGLPEGEIFELGGYFFSISYTGGSGNDVVLTVLGEARLHVDTNAIDTGFNDGLSWDTTFLTLQDALNTVSGDVDIWVAAGTYYPDEGMGQIDNDSFSTFTLKQNVSIYGGFAGDETDINLRDPLTNLTILSGDIDGNDINTDGNNIAESINDIIGTNANHIILGNDVDLNSVVDGFTITAGNAIVKGDEIGGGMVCGVGVEGPSINQVDFIGNYAAIVGGATFGCSAHVTNTQYINNESGDAGGAVIAFGGNMENVVFENNFAIVHAGALFTAIESTMIANSVFKGNANGQGFGGAIRSDSELIIESSLFSGNKGSQGGAINMVGSENLTLINVTMTGNNATSSGGAIYSNGTGALNITNSVIWNNQDASGLGTADASIFYVNPNLNNSHSLIQGFGTSGVNNLDEDPLFETSTDPNSAPTVLGNARPTFGSPILNAGDNTAVMAVLDLDGEIRIEDNTVDLGAYEGYTDLIFKDGFD